MACAAFAELDNRPSDRVERLRDAFRRARLEVETPADIHAAVWSKFLFVATAGGVSGEASRIRQVELPIRIPREKTLVAMGKYHQYEVTMTLPDASRRWRSPCGTRAPR